MNRPLVLAMTGASGAAFGVRLLQVLVRGGVDVHLSISPAARAVIAEELGAEIELDAFDLDLLLDSLNVFPFSEAGLKNGPRPDATWNDPQQDSATPPRHAHRNGRGAVFYHHYQNLLSPIASGSNLTAGMVVCPCSGGTLGAIVHGTGNNLIHRAADVHLKERRPLILVPRETPLSLVQLENMRRAAEVGAVVLPASPGWYHRPDSPGDLIDFIVARILDQLGLPHDVGRRWGQPPAADVAASQWEEETADDV